MNKQEDIIMMGFIIGWLIGLSVVFLVIDIVNWVRFKKEQKRLKEKEMENKKFLESLPIKSIPFLNDKDRIYDMNGDLIWDRVRGYVGTATYVKNDNLS